MVRTLYEPPISWVSSYLNIGHQSCLLTQDPFSLPQVSESSSRPPPAERRGVLNQTPRGFISKRWLPGATKESDVCSLHSSTLQLHRFSLLVDGFKHCLAPLILGWLVELVFFRGVENHQAVLIESHLSVWTPWSIQETMSYLDAMRHGHCFLFAWSFGPLNMLRPTKESSSSSVLGRCGGNSACQTVFSAASCSWWMWWARHL